MTEISPVSAWAPALLMYLSLIFRSNLFCWKKKCCPSSPSQCSPISSLCSCLDFVLWQTRHSIAFVHCVPLLLSMASWTHFPFRDPHPRQPLPLTYSWVYCRSILPLITYRQLKTSQVKGHSSSQDCITHWPNWVLSVSTFQVDIDL